MHIHLFIHGFIQRHIQPLQKLNSGATLNTAIAYNVTRAKERAWAGENERDCMKKCVGKQSLDKRANLLRETSLIEKQISLKSYVVHLKLAQISIFYQADWPWIVKSTSKMFITLPRWNGLF